MKWRVRSTGVPTNYILHKQYFSGYFTIWERGDLHQQWVFGVSSTGWLKQCPWSRVGLSWWTSGIVGILEGGVRRRGEQTSQAAPTLRTRWRLQIKTLWRRSPSTLSTNWMNYVLPWHGKTPIKWCYESTLQRSRVQNNQLFSDSEVFIPPR
jgi:hypothetical protein